MPGLSSAPADHALHAVALESGGERGLNALAREGEHEALELRPLEHARRDLLGDPVGEHALRHALRDPAASTRTTSFSSESPARASAVTGPPHRPRAPARRRAPPPRSGRRRGERVDERAAQRAVTTCSDERCAWMARRRLARCSGCSARARPPRPCTGRRARVDRVERRAGDRARRAPGGPRRRDAEHDRGAQRPATREGHGAGPAFHRGGSHIRRAAASPKRGEQATGIMRFR